MLKYSFKITIIQPKISIMLFVKNIDINNSVHKIVHNHVATVKLTRLVCNYIY